MNTYRNYDELRNKMPETQRAKADQKAKEFLRKIEQASETPTNVSAPQAKKE